MKGGMLLPPFCAMAVLHAATSGQAHRGRRVTRGSSYPRRCALCSVHCVVWKKGRLRRGDFLPRFASKGQQRAGYWRVAPHQATVGDVSSVGKGLRQFPDLRGRCAYCALKRPRDFSCPLLGAHQLLSHSRLAAVSRRAPSYAPFLALVKI